MKHLQRRIPLAIGSLLLALIVAACGGQTVTVSIDFVGDGSGTVTINGNEEFTEDARVTLAPGNMFTVRAEAADGSSFGGFGGVCSSATGNLCRFTPTENSTVEVTFNEEAAEYTLDLAFAGDGSGTVTIDSTDNDTDDGTEYSAGESLTFPAGTVLAVSAAAADGSAFGGFGGACTGTGACEITMDSDKSLTATFGVAGPNEFDVSFTIEGEGDGSVEIDGTSYTEGQTLTFTEGTVLTITAIPGEDTGATYGGDCTGDAVSGTVCTLTVDSAKSFSVTFTPDGSAFLAVVAERGAGEGTITSTPAGIDCTISGGEATGACEATFNTEEEASVTLNSTVTSGTFAGYTGEDCSGTNCTITFEGGDGDYAVGAGFIAAAPTTIEIEIPVGVDDEDDTFAGEDAEEFLGPNTATGFEPGEIDANTRYIELTYSNKWETDQAIGLIFRDLDIPAGADILSARIEFSPWNANIDVAGVGFGSGSFDVAIALHDATTYPATGFPDQGGSVTGPFNIISGLSTLSGSVMWSVDGASWAPPGGAGGTSVQRPTSDVSDLLESWLDLDGYTPASNAAVFQLTSDNSDASNYANVASERGIRNARGTQPTGQRPPVLIVEWQ